MGPYVISSSTLRVFPEGFTELGLSQLPIEPPLSLTRCPPEQGLWEGLLLVIICMGWGLA